jgi:hypothetical protein
MRTLTSKPARGGPAAPSPAAPQAAAPQRPVQRKAVGAGTGDALEREADRNADRLVAEMRSGERDPRHDDELGPGLRYAERPGSPSGPAGGGGGGGGSAGAGVALSASQRAFFEPRLQFDFSRVRLFADEAAARSAAGLHARAYTSGSDIVFGARQYTPLTDEGRWLLAHELTHVVQQERGAARADSVQRAPLDAGATPEAAPATAAAPAATSAAAGGAPGLIAEDDAAELAPGQMRKTAFLDALNAEVCATAESALAGTAWSAAGCPWITRWFGYYRGRGGAEIERSLRRYAPQAAGAASARDYIPLVGERVRVGIGTWRRTGEVPPLPEGAPALGAGGGVLAGLGGLAASVGALLLKARDAAGGGARGADPAGGGASTASFLGRLGAGHPLDGSVAARMSSALGEDISRVRIHTDTAAAALSDQLDARAFAVGDHVAFGAGEYRPGTPVGDAILAHELAHVAQQSGGGTGAGAGGGASSRSVGALEENADQAAAGAMLALWGGGATGGRQAGGRRGAFMRSGLGLQRCNRGGGDATTAAAPAKPTMSVSGDSYDDSGGARYSAKKIKFTVDVPAGGDVHDWALVNWVKGSDKGADGKPYKAKVYDTITDIDFASFQVDSQDADPVYWSDASGRWNYIAVGANGFYATDSPGPKSHVWDAGEQVNLSYKMSLYKLADLPLTTTGDVGGATPVQEYPWEMKVHCDAAGNITH